MIGWTMCSGIGAPEVAAPWLDWRLASEIENFPRAVLKTRFGYKTPDEQNQGEPLLWGDMTEVTPELARARGVPLPDLLVAGTPCQAFSLAGLRQGTDDARGNLTLKFVETCHAIVDAGNDGKLAVLWENVPGVLSDKGNAFGCFLGGLVGADHALSAPDGGSWPSVGMVSGPRSRAAWRLLDAQYFGVAQRRRRLFVVVDFGGAVDPAAVLFERQGLRGNTAPIRQAGKEAAGTVTARTCRSIGADDAANEHLITMAHDQGGAEIAFDRGPTLTCNDEAPILAHFLRGAGFDASEDGSGHGTPLVPICFSSKDYGADALNDMSPTLRAGGHNESHANAGVPPAVAFQPGNLRRGAGSGPSDDVFPTLKSDHGRGISDQFPHVADGYAVRRLTPGECHSLQGFPQGHCAITYRNKPAADGPQYKALGNSMAVPCIKWIMDRMRQSMETEKGGKC
jgi:DNA (cytosine-5)-methyltransferase 1